MLKLSVLASGSRGNSTLVASETSAVLIDAGISATKILNYCAQLQVDPLKLAGIVLTHEHGDHIRGVGPIVRKTGIPIFCNEETWNRSKHVIGKIDTINFIRPGETFTINNFELKPFSIPHDAQNPIGLTIEHDNRKIGIVTDLGYPTQLIKQRLKGCHALMLEFNYNRELLIAGPYTWPMKQRIMSKKGHLSNEDACALLEEVMSDNLQHLILAHISENNNVPELAEISAREMCDRLGTNQITFTTGTPDQCSNWLTLV